VGGKVDRVALADRAEALADSIPKRNTR